jgi:hypothetical protein
MVFVKCCEKRMTRGDGAGDWHHSDAGPRNAAPRGLLSMQFYELAVGSKNLVAVRSD